MKRRRRMLATGLVALAVLGLSACGEDDSDSVQPDGGNGSSSRNGGTSQPGDDASAPAYVGLSKKAAIAKAEADGRVWRITREDGTEYAVTFDYDPERLNFEIDDGTVTKATFG